MKIHLRDFLFCGFVFCTLSAAAQEQTPAPTQKLITSPPQRPRIDDLQKESSSFVVDPDPLDPLPLKIESLKDDDEPVLEDIKGILNSTVKKKIESKSNPETVSDDKSEESDSVKRTVPEKKRNKKFKKNIKSVSKKKSTKSFSENLSPDDPDLDYESRLNQLYKAYNINPTSAEAWTQATGERKVETFIVEKGNTLESISRTLFGDAQFWPKIWALNHEQISNPHQIYPGLKIYFFPGTGSDMPTVSLDSQSDRKILVDSKSSTGRDYTPQMTEFEKFNSRSKSKNKLNGPMPLPDSLPIVRRKEYFIKQKTGQTVIDIKEMQKINFTIPKNPYVLSADLLKTDFSVPESEVQNIICIKDQYIKKTVRMNPQAGPGRYILVEQLNIEKSRLKKTFIYKIVGDVLLSDKNELRIKSCDQLINSDTLIVSESKIQSLSEPTETMNHSAQLVESLEAENLDFFNFGQRVVVSTNSANISNGQELNIYSESAGAIVGKLQIIKTTGTLAIGFLTGISRLIQIGDQVTTDQAPLDQVSDSVDAEPASDLKIE